MEHVRPRRRGEPTSFARNLAVVMKQRGLSLRAVADMAGVSVSSVSDWLNNANPTDYMKVARLARRLGIGFEWLLTGTSGESEGRTLSLEEIFEDDSVEFDGIWKIKAVKLKRRSRE